VVSGAVDHSIVMYFMDTDGEFVEFFTQLAEAPDIAARMSRMIRDMERAKKSKQ
jgi:cytochrome oxidase Cu insertion factor (SCO1/SenC/PrrC family)